MNSAHPFAPGAITRHRNARRAAQLRELQKWAIAVTLLNTLIFTVTAAAGYFTGA